LQKTIKHSNHNSW